VKRIVFLTLLLAVSVFVLSCEEVTTKPPTEFAPPSNLQIVAIGVNSVQLAWSPSPDAGLDDFGGYIIYSSPGISYRDSLETSIPASVRRDTVAKSTTAVTIAGLSQNQKYFFHVRGFKTNGDVTIGSNEVNAAPRPEGTVMLYEFASELGFPSAFDFDQGEAVSMVWANKDLIDIYLGTSDAQDQEGLLWIKSPHLVSSANDWTERTSLIKILGTGPFDSYTSVTDEDWTDHAEVQQGTVIAVKTPDNRYAKIKITGYLGQFPNRTVQFQWAYQPIPNYPRFSPKAK